MKQTTLRQIQCVLLLLLELAIRRSEGKFELAFGKGYGTETNPLRRYHVHIVNGLKNNTLQVHCASADDDLGVHNLVPKQEQEWAFRMNFQGTTLFHCKLSWTGGRQHFNAFVPQRRFVVLHCADYTHCYWRAQEDGVYLIREFNREYDLMYSWLN
ncbi:hypothetical protein P3X46_017879 [Hevea brasiliensis]|uniref:S-protein homolog n=1 Tax=Hevea brasiliensis TaxID=3981 RepID=A0ABQ9LS68_HEVBR|nr:hypothetical protein P3X46_017879 [Hevea brasiliensis]